MVNVISNSTWRSKRFDYKLARQEKPASVLWVGISGKPFTNALASTTATGRIVDTIENMSGGVRFRRTNLVKNAPLNGDGRLRYPTQDEMLKGANILFGELEHMEARIVITLGAAVSKVVVERTIVNRRFRGLSRAFKYRAVRTDRFYILPVHHPSFVLIYRRRKLQRYMLSIKKCIADIAAG